MRQKILIGVLIAALAAFVYFHYFDQARLLDARYQESQQFIQEKEKIIAQKKEEVNRLKSERQRLQTEKKGHLQEIKKLTGQLSQVPPPEKVETVTVKQVEYVPLVQYRTLYQLDQALQAALYKYLDIDAKETVTTDQVITKLEEIDKIRQEEINKLISDRDYFYKKAKSNWFFGYGVTISLDPIEIYDMLIQREKRCKPIRITIGLFFGKKFSKRVRKPVKTIYNVAKAAGRME